jgi:hypothetical protein
MDSYLKGSTQERVVPVVHDLYRQFGLKTRMVVGVSTARSLIRG